MQVALASQGKPPVIYCSKYREIDTMYAANRDQSLTP